MIALLQTSQKAFLESVGWAVRIEPTFKFSILQTYCILYVETFGSFGLPGSFLPDVTILTSVTEPLRNIVSWDKNIFCQSCLLT